jgi:hypothetical protein
MENISSIIDPIIKKYEKLGITSSYLYSELKNNLKDQSWINDVQGVINKVENGRNIFCISREITKQKNDQRVLEMFAEFDVAKRLATTHFFGTFSKVKYLLKNNQSRQPDFLAESLNSVTPVEVKLLSPQSLDENRFFRKVINKINKEAIKQLQSYYQKDEFDSGIIFIWSHLPIQLSNIQYDDLKRCLGKQVPRQDFRITIICILSDSGLWDFYIQRNS